MSCIVSIIVPTFNEERVIGASLDAIAGLHFPFDDFEVLVIDNGSTDRTLKLVRDYTARLNIRTAARPGVYVSALRNAGAQLASGRYLAFIDADCVVAHDFLSNLISSFNAGEKRVIGSRYKIPEDSSWMARAWYADALVHGSVSYVPGGCLSLSRENFFAIGGFDGTLETNEDYELCERARDAGLVIWADPSLAVTHLGTPQTLGEFFRKQRWHGTHVFKVFWRALPRLRNTKAVAYTLYLIAAFCICVFGLAFWAFSHSAALAIAAMAAVAAGPVALGCSRAISEDRLELAPQLAVLYFIYGVARICSLTNAGSRARGPARRPVAAD